MTVRRTSKTSSANSPAASESLPEAELEVLARLHELGEAEASVIRRRLEPLRPLSHASVMTLLGRLEVKGLVGKRKADVGKAFVFFATRSPEATYRNVVGRMLQRVFDNDPVALVASAFGARTPKAEELDRLKALVAAMEAEDAGGEDER